jgi:hypothetical protein
MNWPRIEHGTLQRQQEEQKLRSLKMQIIFYKAQRYIQSGDVRPARSVGGMTLGHMDQDEGT